MNAVVPDDPQKELVVRRPELAADTNYDRANGDGIKILGEKATSPKKKQKKTIQKRTQAFVR